MICFRAFSILACTLLALSWQSGARAEPLPASLRVAIDGIADIEAHPDQRAFTAKLELVLTRLVERILSQHWFLRDTSPDATITLGFEQLGLGDDLFILVTIEGDTTKELVTSPASLKTVPRNGTNFTKEVSRLVFNTLFAMKEDFVGASASVHNETDDALKTVLQLNRPLTDQDKVVYRAEKLRIRWDRFPDDAEMIESADGENFETRLDLRPNDTRRGIIEPRIYLSNGNIPDPLPLSAVCLHRPLIQDPTDGSAPLARFACPLDGECALQTITPAGFAHTDCAIPGKQGNSGGSSSWWGTAYASPADLRDWSVPGLDTLYERKQNKPDRFVGFTDFVIEAENISGIDADSFTAEIIANGVPVRVDGLAAQDRPRAFDPEFGFYFRFGLENLNFAGRQNGCEALSVTLRFYREGQEVAKPIHLTRKYAALRAAPTRQLDTEVGLFEWSGAYVAPTRSSENGIFIGGRRYEVGNRAAEAEALEALNGLRDRFDELGWTIDAATLGPGLGLESVLDGETELRIVGKLRPPRTEYDGGKVAAYGVLVGIEEPSGQLQFTFDRSQARALLRYVLERRTESRHASRIVPGDSWIYTYTKERQSGPDWVCEE